MKNASPGVTSTTDMYHGEKTITASTSTTVKLKHKDSEGSSINAVAIAVPVALLAVILAVILFYFVYYRRQKRYMSVFFIVVDVRTSYVHYFFMSKIQKKSTFNQCLYTVI